MATPIDFAPIRMRVADIAAGRKQMRGMMNRKRLTPQLAVNSVGFASEYAIVHAMNLGAIALGSPARAHMPRTLAWDIELTHGPTLTTKVEVKTRIAKAGWTHPEKFDYVTVPMHQDREPIKAVDLVLFCWYSLDAPRRLWVLGSVHGPEEFKRRATFYREGEAMPRGFAHEGGAYVIETKQLRPIPRDLFREDV